MKKFAIVRVVGQNVHIHPNMVLSDGYGTRDEALEALVHMFDKYVCDHDIYLEQEDKKRKEVMEHGQFDDDSKVYLIWEYDCKTRGAYLDTKSPNASNVSDRKFEVIEDVMNYYVDIKMAGTGFVERLNVFCDILQGELSGLWGNNNLWSVHPVYPPQSAKQDKDVDGNEFEVPKEHWDKAMEIFKSLPLYMVTREDAWEGNCLVYENELVCHSIPSQVCEAFEHELRKQDEHVVVDKLEILLPNVEDENVKDCWSLQKIA